ncbi:MAG TPA: chitobiase/beta-hexosaminidase C-terminal domain-containing protein, partial [Candidatus Omnitrophota bacterium]|nr:chitobiase/beta-hexosaminidase C-terminal domain-containing protein [Candidatus Omnitrophota bacterium]
FWYHKIQFAEPDDELETKGERTAFKTPTLSGEIALDINGEWGEIREFDSEAGAVAWLNANTGIMAQCKTPVASVSSGTYATEQTVTLTAGAGEEIYYTTNGTTPSKTNGTKYVSAVSIAATSALRAISTAAGKTDSAVANYEYIITG